MSRLAARLTRVTRLLSVFALVFLSMVVPRDRAAAAFGACLPAPTNPASPLRILAPSDGAVLSKTVPLAVASPSLTTDNVQVCAT